MHRWAKKIINTIKNLLISNLEEAAYSKLKVEEVNQKF